MPLVPAECLPSPPAGQRDNLHWSQRAVLHQRWLTAAPTGAPDCSPWKTRVHCTPTSVPDLHVAAGVLSSSPPGLGCYWAGLREKTWAHSPLLPLDAEVCNMAGASWPPRAPRTMGNAGGGYLNTHCKMTVWLDRKWIKFVEKLQRLKNHPFCKTKLGNPNLSKHPAVEQDQTLEVGAVVENLGHVALGRELGLCPVPAPFWGGWPGRLPVPGSPRSLEDSTGAHSPGGLQSPAPLLRDKVSGSNQL